MGRWLDKIRHSAENDTTKPTKGRKNCKNVAFVGFVVPKSTTPEKINLLSQSPFSMAQLRYGTERWGEPFNHDDWVFLENGGWTAEQTAAYLNLWQANNPDKAAILNTIHGEVVEQDKYQQSTDWLSTLSQLPLNKDDREFLFMHVGLFSHQKQVDYLTGYHRIWQKAASKEPVDYKKDNAGRLAANTWLRNRLAQASVPKPIVHTSEV